MTTLWEKIKAEIELLEQGHTMLVEFEVAVKSLFESHAAEVADQHIRADEQVSAAVAAAGVLTLDPSPVEQVQAIPDFDSLAPTTQPTTANPLGTDAPGT